MRSLRLHGVVFWDTAPASLQTHEVARRRARGLGQGDNPMEGKGDYYTVEEAARVLKRTPGRIRQMLRAGELEGIPPEETEGRGWKIPAHAVHDTRGPRIPREAQNP